jgi:aldose 1-epimerase
LAQNDGRNALHGGINNFARIKWDKAQIVKNKELKVNIEGEGTVKYGSGVTFSRISDHMEEGYPGKVEITSSYLVTKDSELYMTMSAKLVEG